MYDLVALPPRNVIFSFIMDSEETVNQNDHFNLGVFTKILLQYLTELNLEIHKLFRLVGKEVLKESGGRQAPVCWG